MINRSCNCIPTLHFYAALKKLLVSALRAKKTAVTKRIQDQIALPKFSETSEIISERLEVLRYFGALAFRNLSLDVQRLATAGDGGRAMGANEARVHALNPPPIVL
jgi:hypothetical protein